MNKILFVCSLFILFVISGVNAENLQSASQATDSASKTALAQDAEKDKVKVYYFHATRRCATCMAVEDVTKETLKSYNGGKVLFQSINREEDSKNPLIEKYKVNGQTLLLVKGDKVVDLTNDAFLYARTSPDKFKGKLKATIDSLK